MASGIRLGESVIGGVQHLHILNEIHVHTVEQELDR